MSEHEQMYPPATGELAEERNRLDVLLTGVCLPVDGGHTVYAAGS